MSESTTEAKEFKLVILGGGGVGKSALVIRLVTDNFLEEYDPTIEDSYRKLVTVDQTPTILDILDTAGQEEYSSMQDQWMREGKGYCLVYSISDRSTFEEITVFYEKILRAKELNSVPMVLVGNKCDLEESDREVSYQMGKELSAKLKCPFMETSAKSKINNEEMFFACVREINKSEAMERESMGGKKRKKSKKKSGGCVIV